MTEPRPKRGPVLSPSGRELRLWLVAALAATQALVWSELGVRDENPDESPDEIADASADALGASPMASSLVNRPTGRVVWLDTLPVSERPLIGVPEGWQVVSADTPSARPEVTRVARSRARRVRTRSS
jgi:hypothetical protein